jgi:hypothetical protein
MDSRARRDETKGEDVPGFDGAVTKETKGKLSERVLSILCNSFRCFLPFYVYVSLDKPTRDALPPAFDSVSRTQSITRENI